MTACDCHLHERQVCDVCQGHRATGIMLTGSTLPATAPEALEQIAAMQSVLMRAEQIGLTTEHILHGGMYSRTIRLDPKSTEPEQQIIAIGSLVKRPTILIVDGPCALLVGDAWAELSGYNVVPASAGRKQAVVTRGTQVSITMLFATEAETIREAEAEIFAEADLLVSEHGPNVVIVTGE